MFTHTESKSDIERWAEDQQLGKNIIQRLMREEYELKDLVGLKMEGVKEITGCDDEADQLNCSLINAVNSLGKRRQGMDN